MTKQAVGVYVLIKKVLGEERIRRSGLYDNASNTEDRWVKATILSTGSVGEKDFGLAEGQTVLFDKHAAQSLTIDGEKYHMIRATDVAVIL